MAKLFSEHFVSAHKQVGDFVAIKVGDRIQKNGGNVASHFLTPDGRVIHSVTGPVSASVLLQEAAWALEMYQEALGQPDAVRQLLVSQKHQQASMSAFGHQDRLVHDLYAENPLPTLHSVYQHVFEKILGERVSKSAPRLAEASRRLAYAKKTGRPILFVLHDGQTFSSPRFDPITNRLIEEYTVIVMPIREAPALSRLTEQPPYEMSGTARPIFVVAHSNCEQIISLSGWNNSNLLHFLALGWVESLEKNPRSIRTLIRGQQLLRTADPEVAGRLRELTVRLREEAKAAREAAKQEPPKLAAK